MQKLNSNSCRCNHFYVYREGISLFPYPFMDIFPPFVSEE